MRFVFGWFSIVTGRGAASERYENTENDCDFLHGLRFRIKGKAVHIVAREMGAMQLTVYGLTPWLECDLGVYFMV